jgi:hypothetical protein
VDNNIIIYNCRFKSNSLNLYGLLLIVFNKYTKVDGFNAVISTFSTVYGLEPNAGWDRYEENILDLKWKGNSNTTLSSSLMEEISRMSKDETHKNQLYDYLMGSDYQSADTFMSEIVNRIINDKNLILESFISHISPEEFQEIREKRTRTEEPVLEENVEDGSVILPIDPILSPVKGKPVYELKIGDKLMVRIIPKSDKANYFIDLMSLRSEGVIKPVPADIIDIKSSGKNTPIEILTQLGPGVYGKCIEPEKEVKLRLYDLASDGPIEKSKSGAAKIPKSQNMIATKGIKISKGTKSTMFIVFLFFAIIVLLALFIYFSW